MLLNSPQSPFLHPSPQKTESYSMPAPLGLNAVDPIAGMDPRQSLIQINLVQAPYGARVRTGYTNWATSVGSGGVRTIIPFSAAVVAQNRLFCAASGGIYNITTSVAAPAAAIAFPTSDTTSGFGGWVNYTTIAGSFAIYTDETNGHYVYSGAGGAWSKTTLGAGATQISGVDPVNIVGVAIHKSRAWYVEKNTADAWYMPVGSIYGAATKFSFGNKFRYGGSLVGIYSWTVDGGIGVDDYLIAVSSGGDVIVYKGDDPATAGAFVQQGTWYIGPPPAYRRIAGSFGGELYLLSTYGLIPLSRLMGGGAEVGKDDLYVSAKISPLIAPQMFASRNLYGWEVKFVPSESQLFIAVPKQVSYDYSQFVLSLNNGGWSYHQSLPYLTGESYGGDFFIGTADGRAVKHTGYVDTVSDGGSGYMAVDISFSLIQAYQDPGPPNAFKRLQFIRPIFLAAGNPAYSVSARYDFDLSEIVGIATAASALGALWDSALWDFGIWTSGAVISQEVRGGAGLGRSLTVSIKGQTGFSCVLLKTDLMYDTGNLL